eukprot:1665125-Prymnesium_polylepis.1
MLIPSSFPRRCRVVPHCTMPDVLSAPSHDVLRIARAMSSRLVLPSSHREYLQHRIMLMLYSEAGDMLSNATFVDGGSDSGVKHFELHLVSYIGVRASILRDGWCRFSKKQIAKVRSG